MTLRANGFDADLNGNLLAEIILTGGTINRKGEIKQLGYTWTEERGGVFDYFSVQKPNLAWIKRVPIAELEITHATAIQLQADAKQLNATIVCKIGPMDLAMIADRSQQMIDKKAAEAELEKKISEIEKPQRPACHPWSKYPDEKWNKTYYGGDKYGWSYYLDGVKYNLTNAEHTELTAYSVACSDYLTKIGQIKKENCNDALIR